MTSRWVRALPLAPLVVTLFACCFAPPGGGGGGGAPPPPPPAHPAFDALESHLQLGAAYGQSADEQHLAQTIRDVHSSFDGSVVQIVAGPPRGVVALVRIDGDHSRALADMDDAERRTMLSDIAEWVDALGASPDDLVIGVRGDFFYGARYRRHAGAAAEYDVGFSVDLASWAEAVLSPVVAVPPVLAVPSATAPPGAH